MKLSPKSKSELITAICFMIPSFLALHEIQTRFVTLNMNTGGGEQNGALFPRILAYLLLLLSATKVIGILMEAHTQVQEETFHIFEPSGRKRLTVIFIIFLLYIPGLSLLGFYFSTPLILATLFFIMGIRKILLLIPLSIGVTAAVWYVFGILLRVVLPVGRFGLYF